MEWGVFFWIAIIIFGAGFWLGMWTESSKWREKGDHEYMNRMASGKHLYQVKREN